MPQVNKHEAPDGFHAVSASTIKGPALLRIDRCNGCAFIYGSTACVNAPCGKKYRRDGCDVVFQPKDPKAEIDYRTLLRKYIDHVRTCEGVTYISTGHFDCTPDFTETEWAELEKLEKDRQ